MPLMKSCRWCGRLHKYGEICPAKPKQSARLNPDNEQRRIRSTSAWTRRSLEIRERDHFLCVLCFLQGKATWKGVEVHHIIPLAENQEHAFDGEWLISLCQAHHKAAERGDVERKTLHEAARRAEGVPPRG